MLAYILRRIGSMIPTLMAISIVQDRELNQALEVLAQTEAETIYLVDSFGALYSEQIQDLTRRYLR